MPILTADEARNIGKLTSLYGPHHKGGFLWIVTSKIADRVNCGVVSTLETAHVEGLAYKNSLTETHNQTLTIVKL